MPLVKALHYLSRRGHSYTWRTQLAYSVLLLWQISHVGGFRLQRHLYRILGIWRFVENLGSSHQQADPALPRQSRLFKYSLNVMGYNSVAFKRLQNVDAGAEFLTWFCPIWNSPQSSSQQLFLSPVQQLHDHWFQWQYGEDTGPAGGTPYLHPSRPQGDTTAVIVHPLRTALEHHWSRPNVWMSWFCSVFQGPVFTVAFSRDGDLFASGGADSLVRSSISPELKSCDESITWFLKRLWILSSFFSPNVTEEHCSFIYSESTD